MAFPGTAAQLPVEGSERGLPVFARVFESVSGLFLKAPMLRNGDGVESEFVTTDPVGQNADLAKGSAT